MKSRNRLQRCLAVTLTALLIACIVNPLSGLTRGGRGNQVVRDPGWPRGGGQIFNHPNRIAWWVSDVHEGWRADGRGDAKVLNEILLNFVDLKVDSKRVVIHDGLGDSYMINPNRDPKHREASWTQWTFTLQEPARRPNRREPSADLDALAQLAVPNPPAAQLDIYAGGKLVWPAVEIPDGLPIDDQRLESHGFALADGAVITGTLTDLSAQRPMAANLVLEFRNFARDAERPYDKVAETISDIEGDWAFKQAPTGRYRIVAIAEGYMPRVIGHGVTYGVPQYQRFDSGLAKAVGISGIVHDDVGQPLANVEVRLSAVVSVAGRSYGSPDHLQVTTDAAGRFSIKPVPIGEAILRLKKEGYQAAAGGQPISMPAAEIRLRMKPETR